MSQPAPSPLSFGLSGAGVGVGSKFPSVGSSKARSGLGSRACCPSVTTPTPCRCTPLSLWSNPLSPLGIAFGSLREVNQRQSNKDSRFCSHTGGWVEQPAQRGAGQAPSLRGLWRGQGRDGAGSFGPKIKCTRTRPYDRCGQGEPELSFATEAPDMASLQSRPGEQHCPAVTGTHIMVGLAQNDPPLSCCTPSAWLLCPPCCSMLSPLLDELGGGALRRGVGSQGSTQQSQLAGTGAG